MFFRAEDYLRLRDRVAAAGLRRADHRRDHAGDQRPQIERFAVLSGARLPGRPRRAAARRRGRPDAVREIGVEAATDAVRAAARRGRARAALHHAQPSTATREIYELLGLCDRPR
jgi:methylenetetrahydrofolate reductase (NADPH)